MQGTSHINRKKSLLKKNILNNAFETIVANANHNYVLDPMNKFYSGQKHLLAHQFSYSRLSLNRHLYKTDTSEKRTLRVGPCLSLLLLFDSL